MNFSGGARSLPSARFSCRRRPSQDTAYTVYFPGDACVIVGTAVSPPGQSVSFVPPGLASVLSNCRCQICLPVTTSMPNRSSETPATTASSRVPSGVVTRSATSGAKRLCIARGLLSSFSFQSNFMVPTFAGVNTFSSRTHPVRALSTPSVRKSVALPLAADSSRMTMTFATRMQIDPLRAAGEGQIIRGRVEADNWRQSLKREDRSGRSAAGFVARSLGREGGCVLLAESNHGPQLDDHSNDVLGHIGTCRPVAEVFGERLFRAVEVVGAECD